jgi:hypothetical protein
VLGTALVTTTAADGTFLLRSVPAGLENLGLNAANHELVNVTISAQIGSTVNLGDLKSRSTVFNPASAPSATLRSVFGRGGSEFSTGSPRPTSKRSSPTPS